jgi:DNA-binding transcriptional LysR family regulator
MELRHLRYFGAVAEELNFRRAAERLHLAAPTLSQQIKDLEDSLGVRLFERDTTSVRLTGPGQLFLDQARLVLAAAHTAATLTREAAQGRRGALRIGNAGPLTHGFMPACLQAFGRRFPDVDVTLVEIDLNEQAAAVAAGALEIGFTLRQDPAGFADLQSLVVMRAQLNVVLSASHPLAKLRAVPIAELAGQRLLAIGGHKVSSHGELLKRVLAGRGVKAAAPRAVNGYEAFLAMVASGQGVSLLQKMPSLGTVEGLKTRPLKETGADLVIEARAIWRAPGDSPLVNNFIAVMRGHRRVRVN